LYIEKTSKHSISTMIFSMQKFILQAETIQMSMCMLIIPKN